MVSKVLVVSTKVSVVASEITVATDGITVLTNGVAAVTEAIAFITKKTAVVMGGTISGLEEIFSKATGMAQKSQKPAHPPFRLVRARRWPTLRGMEARQHRPDTGTFSDPPTPGERQSFIADVESLRAALVG